MNDRKRSVEVYRTWADRAWREQCSSDPEQCLSQAYVAGFKDGFVDYVYGGGSGEPPPVPPRPFWNVEERNPRGHLAATDWFAGYRHGAQVAREEGYRERALVPSSMFLLGSQKLEPQELEPLEGGWIDQPLHAEPLPDPIAEPLQPEFMPAPQLQPETKAEVAEPKIPALPTPAIEMPNVDVPAAESLPPSPAVPEVEDSPQQPAPIKSPPVEDPESSELDDLFGSSAIGSPATDRSAHNQHALRRAKSKKTIHRDPAVLKAHAAFASAIRGRRAMTKSRSAAIPTPRRATISKSEDRAEEMFHRLSR